MDAERIEYVAVAIKARWYRIDALHRAGRLGPACTLASQALAALTRIKPWDMYLPEAWWIAHRVFSETGETPAADRVLATARAWITDALHDVPAEFRDSFVQRNPANRALLHLR